MTSAQAPRLWRGVALILFAVLTFAISDVATKYLTTRFPVGFVLVVRYSLNLVLLIAIFRPRHGPAVWSTQRTGLVVVRSLCLAAASITFGLAVRHMPVGEAISVVYLAPVIVLFLSLPVLRERVAPVGWVAGAIGFAGVLMIVQPGNGLSPVGVMFALMCALVTAAYQILSRLLSHTEETPALLLWSGVVGILCFAPTLAFELPQIPLVALDYLALVALAVLMTLGHFLFTAAYRDAPAATLAPFNYAHLAWGVLLGWLVFDHLPNLPSLIGIGMVVAGGILAAVATARAGRRAPDAGPTG